MGFFLNHQKDKWDGLGERLYMVDWVGDLKRLDVKGDDLEGHHLYAVKLGLNNPYIVNYNI